MKYLIVILLMFFQVCYSQTCQDTFVILQKQDTIIIECDSMILISANKLRLKLLTERARFDKLSLNTIQLNEIFKSIKLNYESIIRNMEDCESNNNNLNKQIELINKKHKKRLVYGIVGGFVVGIITTIVTFFALK